MKRKIYDLLTVIIIAFSIIIANFDFSQATIYAADNSQSKGIVILHTNDVHCGVDEGNPKDTFGIAQIAAYRQKLESEGYDTILVDAGDFIQGDVIGTISKGIYPAQIMNEMNYDIAVPGNHEYDYGMTDFLNIVKDSKATYLACNFMDLHENKPVFGQDYKIIEKNGVKIGFVGVTTPKTTTSSTPAYFKNENGEWIYGFCEENNGQDLFKRVQESVNEAKEAGAQIVVAIGHMGIGDGLGIWTSDNLINNTTGIDVFIDGHSHSVVTNTIKNKNNQDVIVSQTGTKLANIGKVIIDTNNNNNVLSSLVSAGDYTVSTDPNSNEYKEYQNILSTVNKIEDENDKLLSEVVAKSEVNLYVNDPETGKRLIRTEETNMGDFCADAYRFVSGADIGVINGGGIRSNISSGDLTNADIIAVHPFGNTLCVRKVTGQQILDALEWSVSALPNEVGRFLQVSGITYEIHTYIDSSVQKNEHGEFVGVDGEYRVKNVKVGGEDLDLQKMYTVASHSYYIKKGGDGFTMLSSGELVQDEVMIDNQMLISYITENLSGTIGTEYEQPYGQQRIKNISEKPAVSEQENVTKPSASETEKNNSKDNGSPNTGDENNIIYIYLIMMGFSLCSCALIKKKHVDK